MSQALKPGGGFSAKIPVIVLRGNNPLSMIEDSQYSEPGFEVIGYPNDGNRVIVKSGVKNKVPGTYSIVYDYVSPHGDKAATQIRTVIVTDKPGFLDIPDDIKDNATGWIKKIFTRKK